VGASGGALSNFTVFPFCRLGARKKRQDTGGIQAAGVIVDVHREKARSYRGAVGRVAYFLAFRASFSSMAYLLVFHSTAQVYELRR
ncbi:hypothetical protein ACCD00_30865, partial [Pseudomonas sp. Pseusp3]|uniref:hypothetical protein n=1 Tax=Pseudomonas sp. Pseusp3 TaxID=3243029 RepID=UPI0039B01F71